jgi:tRNA-2-methylthio-N6-dimethylallyladenosine synthase
LTCQEQLLPGDTLQEKWDAAVAFGYDGIELRGQGGHRIRERLPDVALSTDMIVGFPGETAADFEETLSLVAAVRFHSIFSFKYSERPQTLAAQRLRDDIPDTEKTARIVALQQLQRAIQTGLNERLIGREVDVLVDAASRRRVTELSGRTSSNVVVNLPGPAAWIGRTLPVRVERAGPHSVWGRALGLA